MWRLYRTAKTLSQRPSDLVRIADPWLAIQFDNAVVMTGIAIENAANEQIKTGTDKHPKWESKYTIGQLLDPAFRLPITNESQEQSADEFFDSMKGLGGVETREIK